MRGQGRGSLLSQKSLGGGGARGVGGGTGGSEEGEVGRGSG